MVKSLKPTKEDGKVYRAPVPPPNQFPDFDTILYFAGRLAITGKAKREASKAHDMVRKQFKNGGVTLKVFDTVSGIIETSGIDGLMDFLKEFDHIAKAYNAPPNTQLKFFDGPTAVLSLAEQAKKRGHMLGVMGANPDTQAYPENTDLGREHLAGWHDGQKVQQERFLSINEKQRQEEAEKKAAADAEAKKKADKEAKAKGEEVRTPKTETGETVN
jgi:hypothetical protein